MEEDIIFNESVEGREAAEDDTEDGETLTAAQVFARMEEVWLNEKFSPELQAHKSDVADCVVQQLNAMQQNLDRVKKNDLKACIHRMETERIRYVLRSVGCVVPVIICYCYFLLLCIIVIIS